MGIQFDVLSASNTSSDTLVLGPTRLKGFIVTGTDDAGSVVFRNGADNTAPGLVTVYTPANATSISSLVPGDGVRFGNGIYADMDANVAGVTVFYG
jgi:hypothetical protein